MTADPLVERLLQLDTPAVSDAIDWLELAGRVTGLPPLTVAKRIAGAVVTVKLGTGKAVGGPKRHLCTAAVEAAQPGDIIVVEQRSGEDAAGWGGILSNGASVRGVAGVICDGPVRDVDESRALDFPVFARSATAATARSRIVEEAFNGPVTIGDVTVHPGDYAIADSSGICFLEKDQAWRILGAAEFIAKREALMTAAVRRGEAISSVMGADYEDMLAKE